MIVGAYAVSARRVAAARQIGFLIRPRGDADTLSAGPRSPTGRGRSLKRAAVWVRIPPGAPSCDQGNLLLTWRKEVRSRSCRVRRRPVVIGALRVSTPYTRPTSGRDAAPGESCPSAPGVGGALVLGLSGMVRRPLRACKLARQTGEAKSSPTSATWRPGCRALPGRRRAAAPVRHPHAGQSS